MSCEEDIVKIEFLIFRDSFQFANNSQCLKIYLEHVYQELANKDKLFNSIDFNSFLQMPFFLSDKLFYAFNDKNENIISFTNFYQNFHILTCGSFEEVFNLIFNILDFEKEQHLKIGNLKIFLFYILMQFKNMKLVKIDHLQIMREIELFLFSILNSNLISYEDFMKLTLEKSSDIFLIFYLGLILILPFSYNNIKYYQNQIVSNEIKNENNFNNSENLEIPKPSEKLNSFLKIINCDLIKYLEEYKKYQDQYINHDMNNKYKIPKFLKETIIEKNSELIFNLLELELNLEENITIFNNTYKFIFNKELINKISYENFVYKFNRKKTQLNKTFIVVKGREMYYFKDEFKREFIGMHFLKDFVTIQNELYIKDSKIKLEDNIYYSFTLFLNNKERKFLVESIEEKNKWISILTEILKIKKLDENYTILNSIYESKSYKVIIFKALDNLTGKQVAIKSYNKKMIINDNQLFKMMLNEVEILKICDDPHIIKLFDFFEDFYNFYLILELVEYGDLGNLFSRPELELSESEIKKIIYQMCLGLFYLHSLGIVHRDIKPNNIGLGENCVVKFIDFGFSIILGENEVKTDSLGTAQFAAPEIVFRESYNNQIDIWSLGITIYFMIFNKMIHNTNDDLVASFKRIAKKEIEFKNLNKFHFNIDLVKDLILNCLRYHGNKRISADQLTKHKFFE